MANVVSDELKAAAWTYSRVLSDLLGWTIHPDPAPLSPGWLAAYQASVGGKLDALVANLPTDNVEDEVFNRALDAHRVASQFATLLASDPVLAATPARYWKLQTERQLADDLGAYCRWFFDLGQSYGVPAFVAASPPQVATVTLGDQSAVVPVAFNEAEWSEFRTPKKWREILGCSPRTWTDWKSRYSSSFRNRKLGGEQENNKMVSVKLDFARQHRANFTR